MGIRILLVEDEPSLVVTLTDLLRSENYDVTSCGDGDEAYRQGLAGRFDLMVLDVMLPGRDGFEICRGLRQQGVGMPILMLTARGQAPDKVAGLKLGADDYLAKPYDEPELLARI